MKVKYVGMEHISGKQLDDLISKIKEEVADQVLDELKKKVGFDIGFSLFIYGEKTTHYISNLLDESTFGLIADVIVQRHDHLELEKKKNPQKAN